MRQGESKKEILLLKRVKLMMALRVVLVTLFLGLPLLLQLDTLKNHWSINTFYMLIGSTYLVSILYALILQGNPPLKAFISFQLAIDLSLEMILISVTGGLQSPFPFLVIITIVSASIFFYDLGGFFLAGSSTILFGILSLLQRTRIPPFENAVPLGHNEALYGVFLYTTAFFTVGILSGRLAKRLREKEIGYLDLRVFHEDIVHSMPSGLITTDLAGKITSFNRSATEITGYFTDDVIGEIWWEHFSWQDVQNRFHDLAKTGTPQRFEGKILTKAGRRCLLGVTISALRNEQGEQTGIIATFQDLTEIRNLEEAIHRKERLATIGEMAAGMAHEIRNPLASLSGSIQVLQNELALGGENRQLMEIAIKESERLNGFVTQFLRYARPLPPQREWVNMQDILYETTQLIQNDPTYSLSVHTCLEEATEAIIAFVDPNQMKQVFWNLCNNAYQAMSSGGTLTLSAHRVMKQEGAGYIEVCFCDTGKGILKEDLSNIFEPFFTTKSAGSGLGLAIVQRVIEEHQGDISVESQAGKTTFQLRLPFTSSNAAPAHLEAVTLTDEGADDVNTDEADKTLVQSFEETIADLRPVEK